MPLQVRETIEFVVAARAMPYRGGANNPPVYVESATGLNDWLGWLERPARRPRPAPGAAPRPSGRVTIPTVRADPPTMQPSAIGASSWVLFWPARRPYP